VAAVPDDQTFPAITTDFAGGAFVVWPDRRNTIDYDIYANRLSPPIANAGTNYSGKRDEPIAFNSTGSTDPAGDPLTFRWDFGDGSTATGPAPTHAYAADGVYTATLTVSDGLIAVSDAATVTIQTDSPPDCNQARAIPNQLWPVDHRLVPITIAGIFDPDGDSVTLRVNRVTQDEPLSGAPSAVLGPDGTVALRADRLGNGNGRVYTIWFTATDSRGASTQSSVQVGVPHDKSHNSCIDDGQNFISLQIQ
jgi:PKD repeat protein